MDPKKDDKKKDKLSEEEMNALLEQLKKYKKNKKQRFGITFLLHTNYLIHLVLSFMVNLIVAAALIGFSAGIDQPFVVLELLGFFLAIALVTLIENMTKILLYKYFTRVMLMSMGLISLMVFILIMYAVDLMLSTGFRFLGVEQIIVFSVFFTLIRFLFSSYLRRWFFHPPMRQNHRR